MTTSGYMLFKTDVEDRKGPHPDCAPIEDLPMATSEDWAEVYSVHPTCEAAEQVAQNDFEALEAEDEAGNLVDADPVATVHYVEVDAQGTVTVFEDDEKTEICTYTVEDMFDWFFGMDVPSPGSPTP